MTLIPHPRQAEAKARRDHPELTGVIDVADWQGRPIAKREWVVPGIGLRGTVGLLNGTGGIGKSLLAQQLQTACALNMPWLGLPTHGEITRSLGLYCEDDADELQRRQEAICRYYSADRRYPEGMFVLPRVGQDSTLMRFNPRGTGGERTRFFEEVDRFVEERDIHLIIIDTAADTFGGKEIERTDVRTFIQALRPWVMRTGGFVLITQHPSLTGMASGSGSSGSTAWHNSVRGRLYMTAPTRLDDDGDELPTDERLLKCMKSNYGPKNSKIRLVWRDGVFVPINEAGPQSIFDSARTRDLLLDEAARLVRNGVEMSPDAKAKSSLVVRAREHNELRKLSFGDICRAQEQLLKGGDLVVVEVKKSNRHIGTLIRPSFCRYANEQGGETL